MIFFKNLHTNTVIKKKKSPRNMTSSRRRTNENKKETADASSTFLFPFEVQAGSHSSSEEESSLDRLDRSHTDNAFLEEDISYWQLLHSNREFALLFLSYVITHLGEFLTYIASINLIERQLGQSNQHSRTAISALVVVRLLPNVIFSSFGGTLADSRDRRQSMILLDILGAIAALFFVVAYYFDSIPLVYLVTFVQECISGLYQPCSSSMVPLVVSNEHELKKASTFLGLAWSVMAAVGSAAGGFLVSAVGSKNCFLIDSATYLLSAVILSAMRGNYNCKSSSSQKEYSSPWEQFRGMTIDSANYLHSSFFGGLVFLKFSAGSVYGPADVLNVAYSEDPQAGEIDDSNIRLGILFAVVGVGCVVGPLMVEPYLDMKKPTTLQISCIFSHLLMAAGYFGWSAMASYWSLCVFATLRAMGSSIIWINSGIMLQKFSDPDMLGRVTAAEYALGLLSEAAAAFMCGFLLDFVGLCPSQVSFLAGCTGLFWIVVWSFYHLAGRGAVLYKEEDYGKATQSGSFGRSVSVVPSESSILLYDTDLEYE
jgi:MFS family permease